MFAHKVVQRLRLTWMSSLHTFKPVRKENDWILQQLTQESYACCLHTYLKEIQLSAPNKEAGLLGQM